jgi:hypothetical protein
VAFLLHGEPLRSHDTDVLGHELEAQPVPGETTTTRRTLVADAFYRAGGPEEPLAEQEVQLHPQLFQLMTEEDARVVVSTFCPVHQISMALAGSATAQALQAWPHRLAPGTVVVEQINVTFACEGVRVHWSATAHSEEAFLRFTTTLEALAKPLLLRCATGCPRRLAGGRTDCTDDRACAGSLSRCSCLRRAWPPPASCAVCPCTTPPSGSSLPLSTP